MSSLPDWLVERAALDEAARHRDRLERADAGELAERIAALHDASAAELAKHPPEPALAQIEARVAAVKARRRRVRAAVFGGASVAVAAAIAVIAIPPRREQADTVEAPPIAVGEGTRIKGDTRLLVFRDEGDHAAKLEPDAVVRAGERIQIRYHAGKRAHGVIASIDGAGAVTLHYPAREDGSTRLATQTTSLPHAYVLDDAPRFERFFFLTSDQPIDVAATLDALRSHARRGDCDTAPVELELTQWSLRLRKPEKETP